ncbi:hypothetical protein [Labrenzia sp. 011]|uniref:hypothetical protein n=1 Tax=Labrenzia sp. 011 TaxID=2171494 RepID=UPI0010573A26|nr:hypothetical protein [Labrenzia sp. 011]
MSPNELPAGLVSVLNAHNIVFSPDLFVRDWTDRVEIYKPKRLFWIVDDKSMESRVFASPDGTAWHSLNRPANIPVLNRNLVAPDLKDSATAEIIAQRLTALLHDPRVLLCGPRFASWPDAILRTYLEPGGQPLEVLRSACQTPPALQQSGDDWSLQARLMDGTGALLDVHYTGSIVPFQVNSMNISEAMKPGSFRFADEF